MRDYTLGNFIASLREANGFSQYQLGRLVGVTDKAVSKWQNGATRPRTKTCEKLAAIFGISVDDLLSCQLGDQPQYKTTDGFNETRLWEKARDRLFDIFGPNPPINLLCRIDSEEIAFKGKGIIRLIDLVGTLNNNLRSHHSALRSRDYYMSTLVAWLLGATEVNPMKPHWYCPKCHIVHYEPHYKDGWDLPERRCNCGQWMIRDGHDIPFEGALNYYTRNGVGMTIDVATSLIDQVVDAIRKYYLADCWIEKVELDNPIHCSESVRSAERYLVIPNALPTPLKSDGNGKKPTVSDFYHVRFPCIPLTIIVSNMLEDQHVREMQNDSLFSLKALQTKEVYLKVYEAMCREKPGTNIITGPSLKSLSDIATVLSLNEPTFADLRQIMALHYGADIWQNNGIMCYQQGKAKFLDLPGCREDVWQTVLSHMQNTQWSGTGFPMKVMENVRLGRYTRKQGMDIETERILHEIGLDYWYIECLLRIVYQWGRTAVIDNLLLYIKNAI